MRIPSIAKLETGKSVSRGIRSQRTREKESLKKALRFLTQRTCRCHHLEPARPLAVTFRVVLVRVRALPSFLENHCCRISSSPGPEISVSGSHPHLRDPTCRHRELLTMLTPLNLLSNAAMMWGEGSGEPTGSSTTTKPPVVRRVGAEQTAGFRSG